MSTATITPSNLPLVVVEAEQLRRRYYDRSIPHPPSLSLTTFGTATASASATATATAVTLVSKPRPSSPRASNDAEQHRRYCGGSLPPPPLPSTTAATATTSASTTAVTVMGPNTTGPSSPAGGDDIRSDVASPGSSVKTSTAESWFLSSLKHMIPSATACVNYRYCLDLIAVEPDSDASSSGDLTEALEVVVPQVLQEIRESPGAVEPLERLYRIVDQEHKHNRVLLLGKWNEDVLDVLSSSIALYDYKSNPRLRRCACLILNNLTIPYPNKAMILLQERNRHLVMPALLAAIGDYEEEMACVDLADCASHLACACLRNLSVMKEGKSILFHYPYFLETVQDMLERHALSYLHHIRQQQPIINPPVPTVQGQAMSWSLAMLDELVRESPHHQHQRHRRPTLLSSPSRSHDSDDHDDEMSMSDMDYLTKHCPNLPNLLIKILRDTPKRSVTEWTKDSVEEHSLKLLFTLSKQGLDVKHVDTLSYLQGQGGIHDLRASMIICQWQANNEASQNKSRHGENSPNKAATKKKQHWG